MEEKTLFARRIGLMGFTNILVALSSLILLPILTKSLTLQDYGSYALIATTVAIVPLLADLGLSATMVRLLAAAKERAEIRQMFYSVGALVFFSSAAVSFVFFLLSKPVAALLFYGNQVMGILLAVILFLACVNSFLLNYFRAVQHFKRYSLLVLAQAVITVAAVGFFVLSGFGLPGVVTGLLVRQLVLFLIMAFLILIELGIAAPRFARTWEYLTYGLPFVPYTLSSWIVDSSDRFLIGFFLGAAFVAYYAPGYTLGIMIMLLSAPFGLVLPAILPKHYDGDNIGEVRAVMRYSLKWFLLVAIPCVFYLSLLSKPLLTALTTPAIAANGYLVTPVIAVGALFWAAHEIVSTGLMLKKRTTILGAVWIIAALLNFGVNLIAIPLFGIMAAAVSTLIAYMFAFFVTAFYSERYIKFGIDVRSIAKSLLASIPIVLLLELWHASNLVSMFTAVAVSALAYLGILVALGGLTRSELGVFRRLIKV
jgi:O-antigen/teichoic acid export membrane protein